VKNKEGAKKIMERFIKLNGVIKVWDYGLTKSSVRFNNNIDADLRVVEKMNLVLLFNISLALRNIILLYEN